MFIVEVIYFLVAVLGKDFCMLVGCKLGGQIRVTVRSTTRSH